MRFIGHMVGKMRSAVRLVRHRLDARFIRLAVQSPHMANWYYGVWAPNFRREHHAFLAGRVRYDKEVACPGSSLALLRRNVHRIEKGLTMQPRRAIFAAKYIGETVTAFERVSRRRDTFDADEWRWACDVLTTYFDVVVAEPCVDAARRRFEAARGEAGDAPTCIPYQRDLSDPAPVDFDHLWALARRRRSVRWFLPRSVPRELIDKAIRLGSQAPSACNRQPFYFHVLDDSELVRKAVKIPMGTAGYAHNVPVFCIIVGQQRNYFDERDRHLIYIDASLAAMGVVLALETLGLSSCCINWPDIEDREQQMVALLDLEPDERPIMCMAIGYPDPEGYVAFSQKKSLSLIRRYNLEAECGASRIRG